MDDFKGRIVHPQTWPEDLDYKGKKVVVIGSGATAATLIPAIADDCAHVTMLQRSPTYFTHRPQRHRARRRAARSCRSTRPGSTRSCAARSCTTRPMFTRRSFNEPETVKQELLGGVRAYLGPDYDIETHFTPSYRPWRQRIAFVPDGDLFQGITRRQGLGRHRRDRALHRDRHPAEVRQAARGRHHRHRDRLQPQRARRHRLRDRRQAARFRRHRHLSRHDVHRRARTWPGCSAISAPAGRCAPTWSPTSSAACSTT